MSPRWLIPALLGLTPLWSGCAAGDLTEGRAGPPNFITSGFVDEANRYGNVGAFIVQRTSDGQIFPICSGTLIAPTVFLTAAHCTAFYEIELIPRGFTAGVSFDSPIGFGELTDLNGTRLIPVAQVVTNPNFNRAQNDPGDIGVLLLPPGLTPGITPAALPTLGLLDRLAARGSLRDAVFTAVGYGVQNRVVGRGTPFFQDLNPIPRMFAFSSFNALSPGYLRLSQNPAIGAGGTCFGDSGGPNFLDLDGTQVLAATTVTGDAVCRATNVDYRLDIASARAFLGRFVTLP
jgi:secreted trypsin-like serine protease